MEKYGRNSRLLAEVAVLVFVSNPALLQAQIVEDDSSPVSRFTYTTLFQNPGAPDEIVLDSFEPGEENRVIKISIRNDNAALQRSENNTDEYQGLHSSRHSRVTLRDTTSQKNQPFDLVLTKPPVYQAECVVNFNDQGALTLSEPSLWFDRIYLPWFQACNGGGYVDIRPLVMEHFHLGFENPDILPCVTHPQAYPSILNDDGSCDLVDVPSEPRTYLTTHTPAEIIWLRNYGNNSQWQTFSLNQIRVLGNTSVRICYRKDQEVDLSWLTSGEESGTAPGAWLCWSELSPGAWDLSNWVWDVSDVKITGSSNSQGPFSLDDLKIGIQ